jgi:hypothetical protein
MIPGRCRAVAGGVLLVVAVGACAPLHRQVPAYPARGQSVAQIQEDTASCESWAKQATADPGASAGVGAGVGAGIGAAVGAVFGAVIYALAGLDPADGAGVGAAIGGLEGALGGAATGGETAAHRQQGAYAACMASRGYMVAR